jgi:rubrerythrin
VGKLLQAKKPTELRGRNKIGAILDDVAWFEQEKKEKDWPGDRSKKLGVPLGEIGCPHCGSVCNGAISPICPMCDQPYWPIEILKEFIPELKGEDK